MKITPQPKPLAVLLTALLAAQAAFVMNTSQAQVTFQQVTNGLVDYYPLNSVIGNATPDLISRRDMTLQNMTAANIVAASHPGINSSNLAFNFTQSGGATLIYYTTTGQNPFDGSGDFLPFINQRGATMNFWINTVNLTGNELRIMAECANDGQSSPFFSISDKGGTLGTNASFFLRAQNPSTDPNGVSAYLMSDGTYEDPVINYLWNQGANDTTNIVFDANWHMLTMVLETNGDMHVYIDGNYDSGDQGSGGPFRDSLGNLTVAPSMSVTNTYYNTNIYPSSILLPAGTNTPGQYVRWLMPDICNSGKTAFGGFIRNGAISGGVIGQMSDIGFWNRTLDTNEINFIMTNGLPGLALNTHVILINSFTAGFAEVGQGHSVNLTWNITGVDSSPGSIVINGVDVSYLGNQGSTNITLPANQTYTFTLTAHNGFVANQQASVSVKAFQGVPSDWNLVQRFDGLFANTTTGVNGDGWTSLGSYYAGLLDRFNVVTVNGNKVLSPKSGYQLDGTNSVVGYDSLGAITWGNLNNLTIPPYQVNTLFFRFSLTDPGPVNGFYSGLDLGLGLTDFGFATGPLGKTSPPGTGGTVGPGFHLVRYDPSGGYMLTAFDLTAADYDGATSTYNTGYDYLTDAVNGSPNGLMTNVNYYCWLDVSNDNTHGVVNGGVTNTLQEPMFSLWIQKQGDPTRTLLFSGFHGDRNYALDGQNSDNMTPFLNKVFMSISTEEIQGGVDLDGAFFATNNMVLLDDFYLSANGYDATIPRLFNLTSIVQAANGNVTINWESLGSLFQTNTYTVQRKINLNDSTWTTLQTGVASGGDNTSFTDTTANGNTHAFYRISWP
jgi:hypothetical protein